MNNPTLLAASIVARLPDLMADTANAEAVLRNELRAMVLDQTRALEVELEKLKQERNRGQREIIQALKGAEVLAICLADAKADQAEDDLIAGQSKHQLTRAEKEGIRRGFLDNNDNYMAILDAIAKLEKTYDKYRT